MGAAKLMSAQSGTPLTNFGNDTILVGQGFKPNAIVDMVCNHGLCQLVQTDGINQHEELRLSQEMIDNPMLFFAKPVTSVLGSANMVEFFQGFHGVQSKKADTLAQFESFLNGVPGSRPIRVDVMLVADELLTNASRNYRNIPNNYPVEFLAGYDAERIVFGAVDPFGVLKYQTIFNKISGCFANGVANSINYGSGGAGIGSYLVFNASIGYYIAVRENIQTVILSSMPLRMPLKDIEGLPKNIHIVSIK